MYPRMRIRKRKNIWRSMVSKYSIYPVASSCVKIWNNSTVGKYEKILLEYFNFWHSKMQIGAYYHEFLKIQKSMQIWDIIDRLIKSSHFLPITVKYPHIKELSTTKGWKIKLKICRALWNVSMDQEDGLPTWTACTIV